MNGKEGIINIVSQINAILNSIEQNLYSTPLAIYNGSSIGQHFRHIYDFFRCLAFGANGQVIDYAQRERDLRIEQDPLFAMHAFARELEQLLTLEEHSPVAVRGDFSIQNNLDRPEYASSLGREITFIHDHAVHHLAIIKIGLLTEAPDLLKDNSFGVAPSTIKFRQQEA